MSVLTVRDAISPTMVPPDVSGPRRPAGSSALRIRDGRILTGHVAEWALLLRSLDERLGLTVIAADPRSGTSPMLEPALREAGGGVLVDARRCSGILDVAMLVADRAVATYAPDAASWWSGTEPGGSPPAV